MNRSWAGSPSVRQAVRLTSFACYRRVRVRVTQQDSATGIWSIPSNFLPEPVAAADPGECPRQVYARTEQVG
ncbi:predicted protein [Streptomyces sp. C]|nr:predicted protein [Streptomyces sp. C]